MSLGGSKSTSTSIDPKLRDAALENLAMAKRIGMLGFVPYKEATVAGLSPGQIAAMQNTNQGAAAFGLNQAAAPTGGDLSPYGLYQQALANMAPGQRAFIESMFINPMTGALPAGATTVAPPGATVAPPGAGGGAAGTRPISERGDRGGRVVTQPGPTYAGGFLSSGLASRLPGGVNTRAPGSTLNQTVARLTSPTQKATAADRPKPRPAR